MSVLEVTRVHIDPPETLPVTHLSKTSLGLYERCPMAFKRRYIDHEPERPSGKMTLGKSAGHALAQHYATQIESGEGLSSDALLDEFSADWDARAAADEVDWGQDQPGSLKDKGASTLRFYHQHVAPGITPIAVEREFELAWPDAPFVLTGWIDLETADGAVVDFKNTDKRWSEEKADGEFEPTIYLGARRAEENPASRFEYHLLIRTKQPTAQVVATERSARQLDLLTYRVFSLARSIEWRWLNDCWQGAGPDAAWLCRRCSYAADCPWRRG